MSEDKNKKKAAYIKCEKREMYLTVTTCQYMGKVFKEGDKYEPRVGEMVPYHIVPVSHLKDIPLGVDPSVYLENKRRKQELDDAVAAVGHKRGRNPETGQAVIPEYPKSEATEAIENAISDEAKKNVVPVAEPDTAIGPHAEIDDAGATEEADGALEGDNPAKAFL